MVFQLVQNAQIKPYRVWVFLTVWCILMQTSVVCAAQNPQKLNFQAEHLTYQNSSQTIRANGNVRMWYGTLKLNADQVIYRSTLQRVYAIGNVTLVDSSKNLVLRADSIELSKNFNDGAFSVVTLNAPLNADDPKHRITFTAQNGRRSKGRFTELSDVTYTACDQCKNYPPTWSIAAKRLSIDDQDQTMTIEDAEFRILGHPVAILPWAILPSPDVRRQSGLLLPKPLSSSVLGFGAALPIFINPRSDIDLILTPMLMSKQGILGEISWEQSLAIGTYLVRLSLGTSLDRSVYLPAPYGPSDRSWRGAFETRGRFNLSANSVLEWNVFLQTDHWMFIHYPMLSEWQFDPYLQETQSTLTLKGVGNQGMYRLGTFYAQPLNHEQSISQSIVAPYLDTYRTLPSPRWLEGDLRFESHTVHLWKRFDLDLPRCRDPALCASMEFKTQSRTTEALVWERKIIDPFGQIFTPFTYVRNDLFLTSLPAQRLNFANERSEDLHLINRFTPAIGIDYRYPLKASMPSRYGTHVIEPRIQLIFRPQESTVGQLTDIDSKSLLYDETTLFEWDKFSGYDRAEGGSRLNYGASYSWISANGLSLKATLGQSVALFDNRSYAPNAHAPEGRGSGLEPNQADWVGGARLSTLWGVDFLAQIRVDPKTFQTHRVLTGITMNQPYDLPVYVSTYYSFIKAMPILDEVDQEGLTTSVRWKINDALFVSGAVILNLRNSASRNTLDTRLPTRITTPVTSNLLGLSLGAGFENDCMALALSYKFLPDTTAFGSKIRAQIFAINLSLKSFGNQKLLQKDHPYSNPT